MWVWEIESDGKNDMSKSAKARSSLSWASWNKEFEDKEDQWESKAEKSEHKLTLEDPLKGL